MAERRADYPIHDLFLRRWSPRAMTGEALTREELCTLFEAARWAPSSGNGQPWRFVYALAGTIEFQAFFELLAAGNQPWCARAGALVVVASRHQRANGQPARTHAFDTGAAWEIGADHDQFSCLSPKKRGPFQRVPVAACATAERLG